MSSHVRPSGGRPKGLAPLHLGTRHNVALTAEAGHEFATLTGEDGTILLTRRAGGALGRWLLDWAKPRAKLRLWGIDGIAQECGVSRRTVHKWRHLEGFPPEVPTIGGGPVWEADAVQAWVRLDRRPGGRPRKAGAER